MKSEEDHERSRAIAAGVAGCCFAAMFVLVLVALIFNGCTP
jgi:hypothetical protein